MKGFIKVRIVEKIYNYLMKKQGDFHHFTKVLIITKVGVYFFYDSINDAINNVKDLDLICVCSFIQKDLLTGRDIIVVYATYEDVY